MSEPSFPDINRAAVIVKLKKPFIDWLVYTSKEYDGPGRELKPEDVQTEGFDSKHVYLIPAYDETEKYEKFVRKHCTEIFEHELAGWYTDLQMWPKDRSWKVFQEWFDYEIQTIVLDMTDKPIEYEE
jgi:hypothetical protein